MTDTAIRAGQVYIACHPLEEGRRIRVVNYTPGHARAQVVDANTGLRERPLLVTQLHESVYTKYGKLRGNGYALDRSAHPERHLPEANVRPLGYAVSCLPEDHVDSRAFTITVQERDNGRWSVEHHGACLGADGEWAWGVHERDRGDAWLNRHRFDHDTALRLAKAAASHLTVNGISIKAVLARGVSR